MKQSEVMFTDEKSRKLVRERDRLRDEAVSARSMRLLRSAEIVASPSPSSWAPLTAACPS